MAKRRGRVWRIAAGLALVAAVALAFVLLNRPQAAITANPPRQALLDAAQGLDEIVIDAAFDPVNRTLQVSQTLTLTNCTGVAQRLLVLRTYPSAFRSEDYSPAATEELYDSTYLNGFSDGAFTMNSASLQMQCGAQASAEYSYGDEAQTVLRVSLPTDWATGAALTLRLKYTVLIPQVAYRFGENGGVWTLGNAFAIPSPFVDGEYLIDEYISIGDPFVSECRNYTVNVTAPEDYTVAGTGTPTVGQAADGQRVTHFSAPAVRDFALCVSKGYLHVMDMQDGVLVQGYALSAANADALVKYGKQALACYNARYGTYPYPVLSLCEVVFPFGGMEYPALTMIASDKLAKGGDTLEQLVAHEVAHQWWYAVVGNDEYRQAWQDEALAQFSVLDYWEARYGRDARDELQFSMADTSMRVTIPEGVTPGSPVDYFGDMSEYGLVVYNRGAAALCALNTAMEGKLDGFLSSYYHTYAFKLATRADFEALLKTYTGEDWSPLLSDYLDTYINN